MDFRYSPRITVTVPGIPIVFTETVWTPDQVRGPELENSKIQVPDLEPGSSLKVRVLSP
jgi:hypothetical protein